MKVAMWGEPTNITLQDGTHHSSRIHLWVGAAPVGTVIWYLRDGPYYAMSQVRRYGAYADLNTAKGMVEAFGLYDAVTYRTVGNA